MAGFFDKMLDAMRLGDEDFDDYEDDELEYDDEDDDEPKKRSFFRKNKDDFEDEEEEPKPVVKERPARSTSKITPIRNTRRGNSNSMEVCVVKPSEFDDSRDILETLIEGKTVLLNMEGLDMGLAQRIIDVTSGACFAIGGTLQKITSYIFLVVPSNVDISGDLASTIMDITGLQNGL